MSKKYECDCNCNYGYNAYMGKSNNCCCSLPTLIILILILLQFGKKSHWSSGEGKEHGSKQLVDDSILFIIALFYLSCCNPCKQQMYC